jgi:hypothetical protein
VEPKLIRVIKIGNAWRAETGADVGAENGFRPGRGESSAELIRSVRAERELESSTRPPAVSVRRLTGHEVVLRVGRFRVHRPVARLLAIKTVLIIGRVVLKSSADEDFVLLVERENILEIHAVALGDGGRGIIAPKKYGGNGDGFGVGSSKMPRSCEWETVSLEFHQSNGSASSVRPTR